MSSWSVPPCKSIRAPGPFWRSDYFWWGTTLWPWPLKGFGCGFCLHGCAYIPWLLNAFSSCFTRPCSCLFQSLSSATRQSTYSETRCPRPAVGMLELLAVCSGVSVLLTPKGGVLSFTLGRILTTGHSCLWLKSQLQVCWMQLGFVMVHRSV
jgi:hypothetical protein